MKEGRHCATRANWFPITLSAAVGSSELTVASGECHRYAPRPLLADQDTPPVLFWPTTRADEVCGEWYYGGLHTEPQAGAGLGTDGGADKPAAASHALSCSR